MKSPFPTQYIHLPIVIVTTNPFEDIQLRLVTSRLLFLSDTI